MVRDPLVFLMDEPLSNLDAKLRVEMRAYVSRLHARLERTILYVTHDQVEAMTMGDRVAVMRDGKLQQVDPPQALYDHPASLFVAAFIGSPAMNLLRGQLRNGGDGSFVELGSSRLTLHAELLRRRPELARRIGQDVVVGIRPEALVPAPAGADGLVGEVALVESLGSDLLVHVEVDAPAVVAVNGAPPSVARLTARLEPHEKVRVGDRVRLSVDCDRLHFFDPGTERALDF
jgi:multiple sugar transport system ATP-binding protein